MTAPAPQTLDREQDKRYVTDAEMIRRMGVPEKIARPVIRELDEHHKVTGFPQKSKLFGGRRYWPKVEAWLNAHEGLNMDAPQPKFGGRRG